MVLKKLAPIVIFAYNRPKHLKKTLDGLFSNPEAEKSLLFIFCDGAKGEFDVKKVEEVRSICQNESRFKNKVVYTNETNLGLAKSIIKGVSNVVEKYGKIIVLEDDIVVSQRFLSYMNSALDFYEDNDSVMHVSGYMYPHNIELPETFFFNVPSPWGWGTWKRAWSLYCDDPDILWQKLVDGNKFNLIDKFGQNILSNQLAQNITKQIDTWFIKWHCSLILVDGFTLYPNKSQLNNIGFDSSGMHNVTVSGFNVELSSTDINITEIEQIENVLAIDTIKNFYRTLHKTYRKEKIAMKFKRFLKKFVKISGLSEAYNVKSKKVKINSFVGNNVKLYGPYRLTNSIISNNTYISENAIINNCKIGQFCSIGPNLMAGKGIHPLNGISTHPAFYSTTKQNGLTFSSVSQFNEFKSICIGNDVFIGMNVIILDGVTIGDGAVIGAGSVVSKNIPPYAIAYGNPIKVHKFRFDKEKIVKLLELKWWNFDNEKLKLVNNYFFRIDDFLTLMDPENDSN